MAADESLDELHLLARAAARARGDALFPALAQYIARATNASESLISQALDADRVRTLAVFAHGASEPNYDYELDGTPCRAGITPEDVPTMVGLDMVPKTPEAQARVKKAFESVGQGAETSRVVLALLRHNDKKPIFIQW